MAVLNVMHVFMCSQRLTETSRDAKAYLRITNPGGQTSQNTGGENGTVVWRADTMRGATLEVTVSQEREEPVAQWPGLR